MQNIVIQITKIISTLIHDTSLVVKKYCFKHNTLFNMRQSHTYLIKTN